MSRMIHYEDNLFHVNNMMGMLTEGLALEIDVEFFLDKTIDDLFFIDSSLVTLYTMIRDNTYLISRTDHLKSILRSKKRFVELLESILEKRLPFAVNLEQYFPRLSASRAEHAEDVKGIQEALTVSVPVPEDGEDVISEMEMRFLLTTEPETEET